MAILETNGEIGGNGNLTGAATAGISIEGSESGRSVFLTFVDPPYSSFTFTGELAKNNNTLSGAFNGFAPSGETPVTFTRLQ